MIKIEATESDRGVDVHSEIGKASVGTLIDELVYSVFNVFQQIKEEMNKSDTIYVNLYEAFDKKLQHIIVDKMSFSYLDDLVENLL